jgi:large subunit ribosomal protein L4
MPKKAKKGALRSALSLRLKEQKLVILDKFSIEPAEGVKKQLTRQVAATLKKLAPGKVLIVDGKENAWLSRGTKNLTKTKWLATEGVNVYDVLDHETLIITRDSAEKLQAQLKPISKAAAATAKAGK